MTQALITGKSPNPLFVRWIKLSVTDKNGTEHAYECSVTQAGLTSTGGDAVSLVTLCPSGSYSESTERTWQLTVTGVQDVESADSLQMFLLEHDGEEATFEFYPKVDKAGLPQGRGFTGTVTLAPPDNVGNAASGAYATFTATLPLKGKYTIIDSAGVPIVPGAAATGAVAGVPGYFTPIDCAIPANLAALSGPPVIAATPSTAWATDQHVVLGDGSKAKWTGTAWAVATTLAATSTSSAPSTSDSSSAY